jgi:hypothetical protein
VILESFAGYTFPVYDPEDQIPTADAALQIVTLPGGLGWDALGTQEALPQPAQYSKRYTIIAASDSDMQAQIDAARAMQGRSGSLYARGRDGTLRSVVARCTSVKPDSTRQGLALGCEIFFACALPIWRGTLRTLTGGLTGIKAIAHEAATGVFVGGETVYMGSGGSGTLLFDLGTHLIYLPGGIDLSAGGVTGTTSGATATMTGSSSDLPGIGVYNGGNRTVTDATLTVTPETANMTALAVDGYSTWGTLTKTTALTYSAAVTAGQALVLNGSKMSVANNGTADYAHLARAAGHVIPTWFAFPPGYSLLILTATGAGAGTAFGLSFYDGWN